jgi:apolipoprotein N-acyltransferase
LVNISTVGPSAVYLADGTEVDSLPAFTRGFMNTTLPLRTSKTPAIFTVQPITFAVLLTASTLVLWLFGSSIKGRRRK